MMKGENSMGGNYFERALKVFETKEEEERQKEFKSYKEEFLRKVNEALAECVNGKRVWSLGGKGYIELDWKRDFLDKICQELGFIRDISYSKEKVALFVPEIQEGVEMTEAQRMLTDCIEETAKNKEAEEKAAEREFEATFKLIEENSELVEVMKKWGERYLEIQGNHTSRSEFYYSRIREILAANKLEAVELTEERWVLKILE